MAIKFYVVLVTALLLVSFGAARAKEEISTQSFVIFNTKCANCHEGQCSSRMCFQMDPSGATTHIRNYAGDVSDEIVGELYKALRHMKKKCAYCSSPVKVPLNGKWSKDDILLLSLSSRRGIFVLLGKLKAVKYTIQLAFEEPKQFRVEILSQHFEPLVDEQFFKPDKEMTISFTVEEASDHYLRIRSKKPLTINGVELSESKK